MRYLMLWSMVLAGLQSVGSAGTYTFTGNFGADDDRSDFIFALSVPTTVNLYTTSYASGGFAPVLSLFDSSDVTLGYDAGGIAPGGCGSRVIAATGFCLDAYLTAILSPGSYRVVLTEYDNLPSGANLSDGFARDGQGNFTAFPPIGDAFLDPGFNPRSSRYSVSIGDVDSATQTPEPGTVLTLGSGLLAGALLSALRARQTKTKSN
jgi:hypothetical protein